MSLRGGDSRRDNLFLIYCLLFRHEYTNNLLTVAGYGFSVVRCGFSVLGFQMMDVSGFELRVASLEVWKFGVYGLLFVVIPGFSLFKSLFSWLFSLFSYSVCSSVRVAVLSESENNAVSRTLKSSGLLDTSSYRRKLEVTEENLIKERHACSPPAMTSAKRLTTHNREPTTETAYCQLKACQLTKTI